jgi:7,8-dihydropterin-6-yl-methyl-4-(beta-D-ribofuranosyl)aminobenzene 5'-phosphate synthase
MRITFLVDNLPHPTLPLLTEHGLSLYIETDNFISGTSTSSVTEIGRRILCDMGASGAYIKNAKALGMDLNACHWAFLSHAHADHTGGLGKWIAQYGHIPVYASHHIPTLQCFSSRPKRVASQCKVTDESFNRVIDESYNCLMEEPSTIQREHSELNSPNHRITASPERSENDSPNHRITASPERSELDPFLHEIALAFVTPKGLVIVSCCSHHGALNTIASCMEFTGCNTLHAYIGGLHFVDSPEVEAETTSFIGDWLALYPNAHLYTGHCTCPKSAAMLKAHLPHCHTFYTGKVVEV